MTEKLLETFSSVFGAGEKPRIFKTGGRINIIGEHTDYNGGHVFPCALTMGTWCLMRKREDTCVRYYSVNFSESGVNCLDIRDIDKKGAWYDYCTGVLWAFSQEGISVPSGFDVLVYGNIPSGAGLSSSASLEVCFGFALKECFALDTDPLHIALTGQKCENGFIGVNSGIMDQFAVAMGKPGQAMYLDTASLNCRYVPLELGELGFLIMDTRKKHSLASSKYNERRSECEHALKKLQSKLNVSSLGEIEPDVFEENAYLIDNETERRRARHAVTENKRTEQAIDAMSRSDFERLGKLMDASHESLRDDYEVSCRELDVLVEEAKKQEGVLGARMTGAGFGGCAIALLKRDSIPRVQETVGKAYTESTGLTAAFYPASVGGGPEEIFA